MNDAYFAYPKTMVKSVQTPPGKGGDVTIQTSTVNVPIPLDQSKAWQQINRELNVNLKWNLATTAGGLLGHQILLRAVDHQEPGMLLPLFDGTLEDGQLPSQRDQRERAR